MTNVRRILAHGELAAVPMARGRTRRNVRAYAFQPATPPLDIQLWDIGPNPTDYGVHYWTERSAALVVAAYEKRGNPLQIDVEHNNADADDETGPCGGYARLELRAGAPWLSFEWSAYAVEQITTRQRLFLSPEYDVDIDTGEIVNIARVSLVADPGTHNARMLARALRRVRATGGSSMNLTLILAALKAALSADDPEVAKAQISNLIAEIEKAAGGDAGADTPPAPDDAVPEAAAAPPTPPPPAGESDDDEKKKQAAAAAIRAAAGGTPKPRTAPPAKAPPSSSTETIKTVADLATKVEELTATVAERDAKEETARIAARNGRLPESLRSFAPADDASFEKFCAEPHVAAAIDAHQRNVSRGVKAAAAPTRGARSAAPADPATAHFMAQAFGIVDRPEKSYTQRPDGRLILTHMSRPKAAVRRA
jgi:hypothetical protein